MFNHMDELYVEINKSFRHGFVLTEPELRRIVELIRDQIRKNSPGSNIETNFRIKFQNGAVAKTDNIDLVLSQENDGSKRIIYLRIEGADATGNHIVFEFYDLDSDNIESNCSIKFNIRGSDRDWVFVTSSLAEERVYKIKRGNIVVKHTDFLFRLSCLMLGVIFVFGSFFFMAHIGGQNLRYINEVRAEYEKGAIKNTNELILVLEQAKMESLTRPDNLWPIFYVMIIYVSSTVVIFLVVSYYFRLYLRYNFCWGDYLATFNKREAIRKTIVTVVILGLIVSIVGGVIVNHLKF